MITKERWKAYYEKVWSEMHPINQGYVKRYVLVETEDEHGLVTKIPLPHGHPPAKETIYEEEWTRVVNDTGGSTAPTWQTRAFFRAHEEEDYDEPISTRHTD
jgi:hypothetical protein